MEHNQDPSWALLLTNQVMPGVTTGSWIVRMIYSSGKCFIWCECWKKSFGVFFPCLYFTDSNRPIPVFDSLK